MNDHPSPQTMTTAQSLGQILSSLPFIKHLKPNPSVTSPPSSAEIPPIEVADFAKITRYCRTCQGIDRCQFKGHQGYRPISTPRGTSIEACQYLEAWRQQRRLDNLTEASGIPPKYRQLTFKDFRVSNGNREAYIAAQELHKPLYIHGASNKGKTLLLSMIGNEHLRRGEQVQYITTAEMLLQLNYKSDLCEQRLRHLQEVPILLMDDLGLERRSEYADEQLYMVLEGRVHAINDRSHTSIMVIASHLGLKRLNEHYSKHITERITRITEKRETHLR